MSIISKETWDNMPKKEKEKIYREYMQYQEEAETNPFFEGKISNMEDLFGEENLQPEPEIKTWKDVEKCINEQYCKLDLALGDILSASKDDKLRLKIKATFKIAKLIELGYGGTVTDEEWKNEDIRKFSIIRFQENLSYAEGRYAYEFISFHTPEQRDEFMSYPENRTLVEQYHML